MQQDIKELTRDELGNWFDQHGVAPFRTDQVLKWLYVHLADDFDQMTDLRKELRQLMAQRFSIGRLPIQDKCCAADGTCKFLFRLGDGQSVESVLIPERNHFTLCVSSQVGCAQGCRFCLTGRSGWVRNLTSAEIVGQVWEVRKQMAAPELLTNLVFMGMGEPLANYEQLVRAIAVLTSSDWGLKFANRRVTVSTAGLVPRILDLGRDTRVNLAVSLNAVDDESRSYLMPINRKYALQHLIETCRHYPLPKGRKITFEYILMQDINDSPEHARHLAKLLTPLKAKINLIPFNPYPGSEFQRPSDARVAAFQALLINKHFTSVVRYSKGQEIMAACGQLRTKSAPIQRGDRP